ncbi:extracellular solute-binding protein [Ectopseudomonas mendocina]|uniref:extracellular solute-binding protein n=1 Tax=Ectopseudomonas mendocina TaxID=300 RepID=UPI00376EF4C8
MRGLLFAVLMLVCVGGQAQTLRIYNWKDYIDPQVLAGFERTTGIKVDYQTFTTAQELDEALDAGAAFDLVAPSHFQLQRLIDDRRLQQIDVSKLRHYDNLDPKLLASLAGFSGAGRYVVPYLWSTVGLVIERETVQRALGQEVPPSWRLLFDTNYAQRLQACGIGWLDAPEETFSLWMNLQGKRLPDASTRRLADSGAQLFVRAGALRALNNEAYIEDLAAGRLCVAMAWSGHALSAASRRPTLEFLVPEEGALLTIDSWAIPAAAQQPELAYRFIDYLLEPGNARMNTDATRFYAPLRSDLPEMIELAQRSPAFVPRPGERRRLYFLEPLRPEQKQAIDRQWQAIKQRQRSSTELE